MEYVKDTHFNTIRKVLEENAEKSLAEFNAKLTPNVDTAIMLGVRVPIVRRIAKDVAKKDWKLYLQESKKIKDRYQEEIMMEGLIIAYAKMEFDERLKLIEKFVPKITTWAINDTFCPAIKLKENELEVMWKFILPYLKSKNEFEVRFAVIMMLDNFIIDNYVDKVIKELDKVNNEGYYAKMAVAWTMAEIGIKYNEKAMKYLKGNNCKLDKFTYNKTLQKMRESYRISNDIKEELKKMKIA